LSDFGITSNSTAREFWSVYIPRDNPIGFDFIYELQIIAAYLGDRCSDKELHTMVKKINSTLINPGAHFRYYLK
jgi:hypothetical protein